MVGEVRQQQDDLALGAPVCPERRQDQRNERIRLPVALREAAEILIKSLAIFTDADRVDELTSRDGIGEAEDNGAGAPVGVEGDDRLIEELEICVRAYNCLKRAGIQTVGDLVQKSESELNAIPNFGKRSTDEVVESLTALGLSLRQD